MNDNKIKPLIKWVGGKRQSLSYLSPMIPLTYNRYIEPFIGGGALLLDTIPNNAIINDINSELINFYQVIAFKLDEFLDLIDCMNFNYSKEEFIHIRNMDRRDYYHKKSDIEKALRFLYLNKTCFNGLYRVNSKGYFNTSYGCYKKISLLDIDHLKKASSYLKKLTIYNKDYSYIMNLVSKDDFVYIDPPYYNTYSNYSMKGFNEEDHQRLFEYCNHIDSKGAKFLLSNSDHEFIRELYSKFNIKQISSRRSINSDTLNRGSILELLISNY